VNIDALMVAIDRWTSKTLPQVPDTYTAESLARAEQVDQVCCPSACV
jgi:hypothetical protein